MARRLNVHKPRCIMSAERVNLEGRRFVYVISAGNKLSYPLGSSRIAYIGATKTGSDHILQSAAARADGILDLDGVQRFDVHVVSCQHSQNVRTWMRLERAMLLEFRLLYGEVPICNVVHGGRMRETGEFDVFSRERIDDLLHRLGT